MRLFFAFLLFFAVPVNAQQLTLETACSHISSGASGAEYKAGVDVKGNPVAPADIETEAGTELIKYPLTIPVDIDAIRFMDANTAQALVNAGADLETNIANVILQEDGHVEFNGVDLSDRIDFECVDISALEPVALEKNPEYVEDEVIEAIANTQEETSKENQKEQDE